MDDSAKLPRFSAPQPSTIALALYLIFTQFIDGAYLINETSPPAAFELLQPIAFLGFVCWWMRRDSLQTGTTWPLDLGMFLYPAWVLILPYYLIKTRGLRGLIDVLVFAFVVIVAWVSVSAVLMALNPETVY